VIDDPVTRWGALSQAERDAAYNNAAAVADSASLSQDRNRASADFRAARPQALDLPYGPGPRNAWDIFAGADPGAPCLVFIHGGYWQMNGRENFACVAAGVAAHGWSVALPGYTLAPEACLRDIVAEINAALDWLAVHGQRHGLSGKILVCGWSAGAHLAALALSHPAVMAGLAISGIYDLAPLRDTYLNQKLSLSDEEIEILSPLRLPAVDKPLAVAYGALELPALVGDAVAFHAMRARAQAPGPLLAVPLADHFTILNELRRADGCLTQQALDLAAAAF
jgi:acetyl esterase/lipase